MSESNTNDDDEQAPETYEELTAQLETAKGLLEASHGDALNYDQERRATALYFAIETLEDAQEGKFKTGPPKEVMHESAIEDIERSREARDSGYREATALGARRRRRSEPRTLLGTIKEMFT